MVFKIILTILLVIAAFLVYLIFVPIAFGVRGSFDDEYFKAFLHDPLRLINLRFDTSSDPGFSLRIFYFIKIGGKKEEKEEKSEKKKQKKAKEKPRDRKKKLLDFIKKRIKAIITNAGALLKHCRIHIDDCDVSFSTGEPDTTAMIYGVLSALPFMYGKSTKLDCDLMSDDAFLRGHIGARGHVNVLLVIIYVLKIVFAK
ncbi:MAG: hypothetical protein DUD27_07995 [Lachnospiraceae bacterium]|uniref:DUF2953 domain-containing protein n=1 Tax=Candidatus Weimeria bifida TaxID=2599074 RepID=A0A6N7J0D9_9FIRM|nr:hypothetical protein [Candidatus Weimeria bifida]RRF95372.1 MAG: hypothetical protein DUD27_07995 [Lachnospiraceae bacterium]